LQEDVAVRAVFQNGLSTVESSEEGFPIDRLAICFFHDYLLQNDRQTILPTSHNNIIPHNQFFLLAEREPERHKQLVPGSVLGLSCAGRRHNEGGQKSERAGDRRQPPKRPTGGRPPGRPANQPSRSQKFFLALSLLG
jgi:hypothetical protein